MRRQCDCVVGLREANAGSGVGLFNRTLARRLGVPCLLLDDYAFPPGGHPLLSLKFEELTAGRRQRLERELAARGPGAPYSLFLHTLDGSEAEALAVRGACRVLCGNDGIHQALLAGGLSGQLTRAFAPSLIPDGYEETCRPSGLPCFTFGMASKVDHPRFARLRDLLDEARCDYQLLCSLSVHQTSDGSCLPQTLDLLGRCFGGRFVFLGTLTDQGIAYFLNTCPAFVGFYKGGVRANNTTFNTALRFGNKIVTNLGEHSPAEVRGLPYVLDIDTAGPWQLKEFLESDAARAAAVARLFTWDELIARCFPGRAGLASPGSRVA